jgi:type II secretory pathway pseudopilin PulG
MLVLIGKNSRKPGASSTPSVSAGARRTGLVARRELPSATRRCRLGSEAGFTLFEVLVAAVVLIVGLTTLFGLVDTSLKASSTTRAREGATNLAREVIEDARTIAYAQLSPSSIVNQLQAMNGLADASSTTSGWQVKQRGITYTVTATECAIDDPHDGYGKHVSGGENPFCNDAGEQEYTTGTEDHQPEDLKRVAVDVAWKVNGRTLSIHQAVTVSVAGGAPGLTPSGLHLETPIVMTPSEPVISEEPVSKTLTFAVTSPTGTASMRWSLEGAAQSSAPVLKSGTTWNFSWSIPYPGVSDGTYQVSVQAVDATGVTGPPVSIPVTLIRGVPSAVAGLRGGFNTINVSATPTKVVELQWQANTERNVIGYRVYNPSGTLVCPASEATLSIAVSCIDFNSPSPTASNLTYTAVALYRNAAGTVLQGPAGSFKVVGGPPEAPKAPTGLSLTHNADGSITLSWTAPSGGPTVIFYRIYRGSTDYTSRYDLTPSGTTTTYTDTDAVATHTYWVTSVDANLTESAFAGPVSG